MNEHGSNWFERARAAIHGRRTHRAERRVRRHRFVASDTTPRGTQITKTAKEPMHALPIGDAKDGLRISGTVESRRLRRDDSWDDEWSSIE